MKRISFLATLFHLPEKKQCVHGYTKRESAT